MGAPGWSGEGIGEYCIGWVVVFLQIRGGYVREGYAGRVTLASAR